MKNPIALWIPLVLATFGLFGAALLLLGKSFSEAAGVFLIFTSIFFFILCMIWASNEF